ncbi:hypothetical protein [Streptomyces sp. SBT349]|uniref:hypothetical protein n=1 Tax=Streptomyces sp. SBT349 TaxID=1580539 RepID=UPI00131B4B4A|nr:hypothetical protein [Streptomyces sp. SBT349]
MRPAAVGRLRQLPAQRLQPAPHPGVHAQTRHRRADIEEWAFAQIDTIADQWADGQGFPFRFPPPSGPSGPEHRPGLQGTEMWLATLWYIADLLGIAESLGYRPRGVHRPEPAITPHP